MSDWKALPTGEDVPLKAGSVYAVVASVSSSTTRAKVDAALAKYFPGVSIITYFEQGQSGGPPADPDTDRKQIAAVVRDESLNGTLSWSKSIPIVAPDIYTLSGAWVLEGASTAEALASLEDPWKGAVAPPRRPSSAWPWVFGTALVVTAGVVGYVHRERLMRAVRSMGASHG
jgi:hypothetical protein